MKKIFIAAAIASVLSLNTFAKETSFYNTISSDIVKLSNNDGSKYWGTDFAGISNRTAIELLAPRVDCGIDVTFKLEEHKWVGPNDWNVISIGNYEAETDFIFNSWYIEFRPIERLTFGLNPDIWTSGSYLPVAGSNIKAGNIGSDFDVVFRPIDGLRLAAGIDFLSYFGHTKKDYSVSPMLNFGFDWTYGKLYSISASLRNIANGGRSIAIYGEYAGLKGFDFRVGYAYNGSRANSNFSCGFGSVLLNGHHLINGAMTYIIKQFKLDVDTAITFDNKYIENGKTITNKDIYLGAKATYNVTNNFTVGAKFGTAFDFAGKAGNIIFINPYVVGYINNHHELGAGFKATFNAGDTFMGFPIYYKYKL